MGAGLILIIAPVITTLLIIIRTAIDRNQLNLQHGRTTEENRDTRKNV